MDFNDDDLSPVEDEEILLGDEDLGDEEISDDEE